MALNESDNYQFAKPKETLMSNEDRKTICEVRNIYKRFGATQALNDVSIQVLEGETHGLVGQNGAGKSTLVGVLTGMITPDFGEVFLQSKPAPNPSAREEWQQYVGCVYQKPTIVPTLSVAENLFLGNLPVSSNGFLRLKEMKRLAREALLEWDININVEIEASRLTVNQRNLVEIIRALLLGTRFIILDEPTAGLDSKEISKLFDRIRSLKASGVSFIYISHHLEEVFEICQKVTILRDGCVVTSRNIGDLSRKKMVSAMIGQKKASSPMKKEILDQFVPQSIERNSPMLDVQNLTVENKCKDVNFQIFPGECVGLAGHKGSGTTVVAESIVGLIPYKRGEIKLSSQLLKMGRPDKAFKKGIGYVPEDRYTQGFIGCMSLADNIMLPVLRRLSRWGILSLRRQRNESQKLIKELDIKAASIYQKVGELSGGNQQKSTVARALSSYPKLLVLVEPTAGVDVAAKISILANIRELRDKGLALLLVSDDLEDLEISDRIIVMFKGRVYKEIERGWNPHDIVMAMEGWTPD